MPYNVSDYVLDEESQAVTASQTDQQVSKIFRVSDDDSMNILIDIVASSVTDAGADNSIVAKLQDRMLSGQGWNDKKTVAITGNGTFTIKLMPDNGTDTSGDRAFLPLRPQCRVVVTTAAGDAATIDNVLVTRRRNV